MLGFGVTGTHYINMCEALKGTEHDKWLNSTAKLQHRNSEQIHHLPRDALLSKWFRSLGTETGVNQD